MGGPITNDRSPVQTNCLFSHIPDPYDNNHLCSQLRLSINSRTLPSQLVSYSPQPFVEQKICTKGLFFSNLWLRLSNPPQINSPSLESMTISLLLRLIFRRTFTYCLLNRYFSFLAILLVLVGFGDYYELNYRWR